MQLAIDQLALLVLAQVFRQQVAAIGGGAEQHIIGRGADRTVEHRFERLVAGIIGLEGQIIAVEQEALGTAKQRFNDLRQVEQIMPVDLDQAQALPGVFVEQRLDQ